MQSKGQFILAFTLIQILSHSIIKWDLLYNWKDHKCHRIDQNLAKIGIIIQVIHASLNKCTDMRKQGSGHHHILFLRVVVSMEDIYASLLWSYLNFSFSWPVANVARVCPPSHISNLRSVTCWKMNDYIMSGFYMPHSFWSITAVSVKFAHARSLLESSKVTSSLEIMNIVRSE